MTTFEVNFIDGTTLNFNFSGDINLHNINGNVLVFDDLYINLDQVKFLTKKVEKGDIK